MKAITRIFVLLLAVCMLCPLLASCAGEKDPTDQPTATPTATPGGTDDPDEKEKSVYDVEETLPPLNYGGRTFTILYLQEKLVNNFYVDAMNGDMIDEAVCKSIQTTEEKLQVKIVAQHSGASDEYQHRDLISNQIKDGNPEFDLTRVHDVLGANLSIEGNFLNLYDLDYLSLDQEWWIPKTVESLTFKNKLFLASSAMSYSSLRSANVVFMNKTMLNDRSIELPYTKVANNEWYLEDMLESIENVYIDTNTNGEKDNEDIFGLSLQSELYAFYESFGVFLAGKSEDNEEIILNGHDPRAYDLIEQLYNVCFENNGGYLLSRETKDGVLGAKGMFLESRAIYTMVSLGMALEELRTSEIDYGILPIPMLDEAQGQYYAGYTDRYFAVPNTCTDTEFTGAVLESMSMEGYRNITPAYFEVALKDRYSRDLESKEMMDIIRRSMVLDFAYVYGNTKWWSRGLNYLLTNHSKDYASYYETLLSQAEARVEVVTEAFEKID